MRIFLVGSGGRESALAWKMAQSSLVEDIMVAPGNPGMKVLSPKISIQEKSDVRAIHLYAPDLVVIGPEGPLNDGLVDLLDALQIPVVGPTQAAALLEGSKVFCKEVMVASNIPTADYRFAQNILEAADVIESWPHHQIVIKVDELAQGKGVVVCSSKEEAYKAARAFFDGSYLGSKVKKILIEDRLQGPEVSAFALCDGMDFLYLGSATDYKRLQDGDEGPNTGGMGTISPSPVLTEKEEEWIQSHVFAPLLKTMRERGTPFKGFLFAGIMKTPQGLSVLEFNTRLGDPETQVLLPRMEEDFVPHLLAAAKGELAGKKIGSPSNHALHIVMCAKGYPGVNGTVIQKGDEIYVGQLSPDTIFFPAGVSSNGKELITSGGRVCGLTVIGRDLKSIRSKAYEDIKNIQFHGAHFRLDIGLRYS